MQTERNDESLILLKAVAFSAEAHREQRRKDPAQTPYINHPVEVANLLASTGVQELDVLVAALLHDTVEDTPVTETEIENIFGAAVAKLVMEVTDDKSLPKAVRKQKQIDSAADKSSGAKLIKIADKSCNLASMGPNSPVGWDLDRKRKYISWAISVVGGGCRGENALLDQHFDQVVDDVRQRLGI